MLRGTMMCYEHHVLFIYQNLRIRVDKVLTHHPRRVNMIHGCVVSVGEVWVNVGGDELIFGKWLSVGVCG